MGLPDNHELDNETFTTKSLYLNKIKIKSKETKAKSLQLSKIKSYEITTKATSKNTTMNHDLNNES
jgi:hypothetical protein